MSNELLGDDLNLYWDTANNYNSPTWERQISVADITFDSANEQVEIPKRISVKTYKKGRGDWELSFTANYNKDNLFLNAIRDAITNGTRIHLALAAGLIASEEYWHAWWFLSGPLNSSLDEPAQYEVSGKAHFDLGVNDTELPAFVPASG